MTLTAETQSGSKLAAIVQNLGDGEPANLLTKFARHLFGEADTSELDSYAVDDLTAVAASAFETFRVRLPGEPSVGLFERRFGTGDFLCIDIVNDDMPFLLDSAVAELRGRGLTPELVAHPVFEVRRDAEGRLLAIAPAHAASNGLPRESFIHLQIRKTGTEPALDVLKEALLRVLADVRTVVLDFTPMTGRLREAIAELERNPPPAKARGDSESIEFLRWLSADNFIFLGARDYVYSGDEDTGELQPIADSGLGLLRDTSVTILRRRGVEQRLTPSIRSFFLHSPPVIVAKHNDQSTVHRRVHMDVIAITRYGPDGRITGQWRLTGLFTATVYNLSTLQIPLLKQKTAKVLRASGHPEGSYSQRSVLNILETFPRDELFQMSPEQLTAMSEEIMKLDLTPRPRVFIRRDEFERFISAFIYVPRERYTTGVRMAEIDMLEQAFGGEFETFTPFYSEGPMVRTHIVIWRKGEDLRHPSEAALEETVSKILTTWTDEVRDLILARYGSAGYALVAKYAEAFPAGYQETNNPERALEDIQRLEKLGADRPADADIYHDDSADPQSIRATLLQLDAPLPLSKRVPILENFGFDVVSERTFEVTPRTGGQTQRIYLHDCALRLRNGGASRIPARRANLEEGFLAVWRDAAANDRFNGLILGAGLSWREAALLRAYSAYLRQTGAPYGTAYVAEVLNRHPAVAANLVALFDSLFNPRAGAGGGGGKPGSEGISKDILQELDQIPVLDEDRVLRTLLAMMNATLRTNFYHRTGGEQPETIAFKVRSGEIDWLPEPKPFAEIFVYSPRFEGVHLRGGPVARGGLRWSDRPQDFRTEILSLAKAQQVKNVVIVPQGAKGGFVPRALPKANRETVQAEGVAAYKAFISSLLSITDNRLSGAIVPPPDTVRRDGDDPYLVVAADKGTATFSDIANEISLSRDFWLGDAFASGGSAGYDHKKMAITARGAWEAVKRHFQEMNIDIQSTPFTVAGVGDMSGDVFGNGMLLSKAIKLVAAFDHRDIFIDPDPDPGTSWLERKRLYDLPRSSWQDYDRAKISKGGGVFARTEKFISLSPEARKLLGLKAVATPAEVMAAIVKAPVDLLWFGGIGTYVRGSGETDAQAGDRANDAIRAAAKDLQAKVIGEGANLGVTQRGRIEYALLGGRINTDAIDNSAGVNTSDVEVNIKIALGAAVQAGKLDTPSRNQFLIAMTDEVAAAVLKNNYLQTLAISLADKEGLGDLGFQERLMQRLEKEGRLNRALETLPSDAAIAERAAAGKPLTRPELAVLLAYAKIDLNAALIASSVPDDPYLGRALVSYFPPLMRERFADEIRVHPLRREIIATCLTNDIINSGGPTFIVRLVEETGNTPSDIAYAFEAVMAVFGLTGLYSAIDELDGKIDGQIQLKLYQRVQALLRRQTSWFLRHGLSEESLEPEIARYRDGVAGLAASLPDLLPARASSSLAEDQQRLLADGVPPKLAQDLSSLGPLSQALDIVQAADSTKASIPAAGKTLFAIRDAFHLHTLAAQSEAVAAGDYYDRLAVNSVLASLASSQRIFTQRVLEDAAARGDFGIWRDRNAGVVRRLEASLSGLLEGRGLTLAKLTVAVAQFRDVAAS
jgi:glutamate dehydrogenase